MLKLYSRLDWVNATTGMPQMLIVRITNKQTLIISPSVKQTTAIYHPAAKNSWYAAIAVEIRGGGRL